MEQQRVRRTFALLALVAFARCGSADLSVVADANVTGTPAPTSAPDVTTAHAVNEPAPKTTAASVSINNTSFLYDAYGGTGAWRWRSEKQRGSPCLDGGSRRVGATVRGNEIVRYYLEGVFFFIIRLNLDCFGRKIIIFFSVVRFAIRVAMGTNYQHDIIYVEKQPKPRTIKVFQDLRLDVCFLHFFLSSNRKRMQIVYCLWACIVNSPQNYDQLTVLQVVLK